MKSGRTSDRDSAQETPEPSRSLWREYTEAILIALLFLKFANTFFLQTFYIPSGSMEDTLLVGDRLFVNRFVYGSSISSLEENLLPLADIRRGDVVIFRSPEDPTQDLVKRCIGLPGDEIEVRDKNLLVNGERLDDLGYVVHKDPRLVPAIQSLPEDLRRRDQLGPVTVPEGEFFCMGDNRDYSYDSRFWGTVPAKYVKGRAFMLYGSLVTEPSERDEGRFRWNRIFKIIR